MEGKPSPYLNQAIDVGINLELPISLYEVTRGSLDDPRPMCGTLAITKFAFETGSIKKEGPVKDLTLAVLLGWFKPKLMWMKMGG
jgi:hypothetical protein